MYRGLSRLGNQEYHGAFIEPVFLRAVAGEIDAQTSVWKMLSSELCPAVQDQSNTATQQLYIANNVHPWRCQRTLLAICKVECYLLRTQNALLNYT